MSKKPKEEKPVERPVPVALSDNDVLMLLEAAALNAGSKAASIHVKQIYSALDELYKRRTESVSLPNGTTITVPEKVWEVPSGWRGKDPWFKVGDKVVSVHAPYTFAPLQYEITEITERGFKYKHERWSLGPRIGWTEGGETFEPSSYQLVYQSVRNEHY